MAVCKKTQDKTVATTIAQLQPQLEKAKTYVDSHPENAEVKELCTQAKAGITFIEDDFSQGVHNPAFARVLMARRKKLLEGFAAKYLEPQPDKMIKGLPIKHKIGSPLYIYGIPLMMGGRWRP